MMSEKFNLTFVFKLVAVTCILAGLAGLAGAANWTDASGVDHLWSTPANWNTGVPSAGSDAFVNLAGASAALITTGGVANNLFIGSTGTGQVDISGGTLTVATFWTGSSFGGNGTVNLSGNAAVQVSGEFYVGPLGRNTGTGTVNVTGGTVTAGVLNVGHGGTGHLQLDGGTCSPGILSMRGLGGTGTIDITGGTLILNGARNASSSFFSDGWITAYGGAGELVFEYSEDEPRG